MNKKNRNRYTDIENKLIVDKEEGGGAMGILKKWWRDKKNQKEKKLRISN